MARVRTRWRWRMCYTTPTLPTLALSIIFSLCWTNIPVVTSSSSDCWFNEQSHQENQEVPTAEPCLNCTCRQGALVCYLRVCAQLPNPPPPGCIIVHRYKKCCPELTCTDSPASNTNSLEARSDPEDINLVEYSHALKQPEVCIANGTVYGSGSAMTSSSYCEYCFCIKGKQKCVRPKCLLRLEGCKPVFEAHSCCPVHYNCSGHRITTTQTPIEPFVRGGCIVSGTYYPEGSRVLGIGHTECDNCYCIKGLLRCEPMACSPPFSGCHPVVTSGECCASSYNCNGTIRIKAQANYGNHPTISKEYAKLRRESDYPKPFKLNAKHNDLFYQSTKSTTKTAKTSGSVRHGATTRQFSGINKIDTIVRTPLYSNTVSTKSLQNISKPPANSATTTSSRPLSTTQLDLATASSVGTTNKQVRLEKYTIEDDIISLLNLLTNENDSTTYASTLKTETETEFEQSTTTVLPETTALLNKSVITTTDCVINIATTEQENSTSITELTTGTDSTTTDGISVTEDTTLETTTIRDVTEVNLQSKVKVDTITPQSNTKLNLIVNLSKGTDEDYGEYDYNHPTLPPSLPNLQIIPFVAADAVDTKNDKERYSIDRLATETSNYGLFSPPTETEGGFQPPNSSIFQTLYEKGYHSTVEIPFVTSPVPAITNPPKSPEHNCNYEGREVIHGESVTSEGVCIFCVCFYGNIVCPTSQCPSAESVCRRDKPEPPSCCPKVVCDDYKRLEVLSEPNITLTTTINPTEDVFALDRLYNFLFSDKQLNDTTTPTSQKKISKGTKKGTLGKNTTTRDNSVKTEGSAGGVTPLKLAGCNIYGRMYRVGRIISELSSPCRECKCTEIGVQCRSLIC